MRYACISFILSAALICGACSRYKGNFEAGLAAYEKRDYATAIKELEPLAKKGNSAAQYHMGMVYMARAASNPQEVREMFEWFHKAAEQGHAESASMLSDLYGRGIMTREDPKKGIQWRLKAADLGHTQALVTLGDYHQNGLSMPSHGIMIKKNLSIAYALYKISYEKDPSDTNSAATRLNHVTADMTEDEMQVGKELQKRISAEPSALSKHIGMQ